MGRPMIGITGMSCTVDTFIGPRPLEGTSTSYVRAVQNAGGIAVVLPAVLDPSCAAELCDGLDGLVFSGGGDIDPVQYGEPVVEQIFGVSRDRDEFERELLTRACAQDVPVLAICRGMQLLNVIFGGTLHQHIADYPSHFDIPNAAESRQPVDIEPSSQLCRIVGTTRMRVNSLHHQAIRTLGESVVVTATGDDGIIEGLEVEGRANVVGVQWHPELLTGEMGHPELFRWLIRIAASRSDERAGHAVSPAAVEDPAVVRPVPPTPIRRAR